MLTRKLSRECASSKYDDTSLPCSHDLIQNSLRTGFLTEDGEKGTREELRRERAPHPHRFSSLSQTLLTGVISPPVTARVISRISKVNKIKES